MPIAVKNSVAILIDSIIDSKQISCSFVGDLLYRSDLPSFGGDGN